MSNAAPTSGLVSSLAVSSATWSGQGRFALLSPPYSNLTYSLPDCFSPSFWQPGLRVAVPLGKGLRAAVLLEVEAAAPPANSLPYQLKAVGWPLEASPILTSVYLDFMQQLALRQAETPGRILGNLLPAGLKSVQTRWRFYLPGKPKEFSMRELAFLPPDEQKAYAILVESGQAVCAQGQGNVAGNDLCALLVDPPWAVRPTAHKQIALLDFLLETGICTRRRLQKMLGDGSGATLDLLAGRGLVSITPQSALPGKGESSGVPPLDFDVLNSPPPYNLSAEQQEALAALTGELESGGASTHLLYGLTGSGKTAVYLELVAATLKAGRSVMLLAPEVALALKLRADVQRRFPHLPFYLYHGYQPQAAREACFRELAAAARQNRPGLVVGTRSALFLPMDNIGAIVLDEEHDGSFKQDEGLNYQAKDLAWYRAARHKALLVLGSATPDVKTFYAVQNGHIAMHRLRSRVGGGRLPAVRLVRLERSSTTSESLAEESLTALKETVKRGEQAIILLNRRGYAPLMYCLACGTVAKCPHCEIALTYHKGRERLVCHYCGHNVNFPSPCLCCRNMRYLPLGHGTEKLEESLLERLSPACRILRLDRDSTRRPGRMEEILEAFGRGEAQVLVGTQMLSKGHHFPDVTLAIVADGDLGLNLPDYRAAERTFQLLVQASGRSGRGANPGQVLIQTRDPGHYCWQHILNADYEGFYAQELALRQKRNYPPFVYLALLRLSYPLEMAEGPELMAQAGSALKEAGRALEVTVLGPAPAPLPLLKGRRRFQCLLKGTQWRHIRQVYAAALSRIGGQSVGKFRLSLDLDPVNML